MLLIARVSVEVIAVLRPACEPTEADVTLEAIRSVVRQLVRLFVVLQGIPVK